MMSDGNEVKPGHTTDHISHNIKDKFLSLILNSEYWEKKHYYPVFTLSDDVHYSAGCFWKDFPVSIYFLFPYVYVRNFIKAT